MRLMRYTVSDGCRMTEVDSKRPRWAGYAEAEQQLGDIVEVVNGRIGSAVRAAWFEAAKPVVTVELLYADSSMVAGVFQNGAIERELTNVTTRFGYRVEKVETNVGALAVGDQAVLTVTLAKVPGSSPAEPKAAKKPKAKVKKPKAKVKKPKAKRTKAGKAKG